MCSDRTIDLADASDEINRRHDNHPVPCNVDKNIRKKPRKALVVKRIPQHSPKLVARSRKGCSKKNSSKASKISRSKKSFNGNKNSSTAPKLSHSKKGLNGKKNFSTISEVPAHEINLHKRKLSNSDEEESGSGSADAEKTKNTYNLPTDNKNNINKRQQPLSIQLLDLKRLAYNFKKRQSDLRTQDGFNQVIKTIAQLYKRKEEKEENEDISTYSYYQKRIDQLLDEKTLGQIIHIIIQIYNNRMEEDESNEGSIIHYELQIQPELHMQNYQLISYSCLRASTTALSKKVMLDPLETQHYYFILFFYKKHSSRIISATSGQAWHVVQPYVDYTFPIKIGTKTGDSNKIKEVVKRSLFGDCVKAVLHFPQKSTLNKTLCLYDLIESFTCQIDPDSSLHHLLAEFEPGLSTDNTSSSKQLQKTYYITIKTGGVRIENKIELTNYPKILNIFSNMMDDMQDNEERNNGFEFLNFLKPPRFLKKELDESLIRSIFTDYQKERQPLVYIRYKYLEDFLYCNNFQIETSPSRVEELESNPPEIEEIINIVMDTIDCKEESEKENVFLARMRKAKLKFTNKNLKCYNERLLDCMEGELHHSDDKTYFKIRNMWYAIEAEYLVLLHEDFIRVYSNALITEDSERWLKKTWKRDPGKLKETILNNRLNKLKGVRNFIKTQLNRYEVYYVDNKGTVKQNKLVGEILENKVISNHKKKIEEILCESETFSEDRIKTEFKKDANVILTELKKLRKVLYHKNPKNDKEWYVLNPFPYYVKQLPGMRGKYEALVGYLEELYEKSICCESEGTYNSCYLKKPFGIDNQYLLFDKICPNGIEPCDILKFTDNKVYLYHVKEKFGQHTREACSQIFNAAISIRNALSTNQSNNYLQNLWYKATTTTYEVTALDEAIKNQMKYFNGAAEFIDMFRSRELIFVYAYCPTSKQSFSDSVENALKVAQGKNKDKLIEILKEMEYLDSKGRLTRKLASQKKEKFILKGGFERDSEEIFEQLKEYNFSESTIGKMEIVRLANNLRGLGYDLKIYEIANE